MFVPWTENHLSSFKCGFLNIFSRQNLLRSLSSLLFLLRWNKNGAKKCLKNHIPFDFWDDSTLANQGAGKTIEKPLKELAWNQENFHIVIYCFTYPNTKSTRFVWLLNTAAQFLKRYYHSLYVTSFASACYTLVVSLFDCSLPLETRLNLSVSCGGKLWIESTDIFSDVLFGPLHGTLGLISIYQSINVKSFELPQCFTFQKSIWFYAILRAFVLYSHYGDSISSKKLKVAHYCKVRHIVQINREAPNLLPGNRYNWKTNSGMNVKVGDIFQYHAYKIIDVLD